MMRTARELVHRRSTGTLRRAVERLPAESRQAMLAGLEEERPIIAGAYSAGPAVCPALAAYRRGARTGYGEFAHAWDRYTRGRGVRQASEEELSTLITMLQESLEADGRRTHRLPGRRNGWAGRVREAEAILERGRPGAVGSNGAGHSNGHTSGNGAGPQVNGNGAVASANGNGSGARTRARPERSAPGA